MGEKSLEKNLWFILAQSFNVDGGAASQTITDRLAYFKNRGVDFVVLSAPTGIKDTQFPHYQIISPAPSGIRFEMRFIIKHKVRNKTAQNILKAISAFICFPFYASEKIFLHFDSQWSWFLSASIKGSQIIKKHHPALLYSTAGPPSTHLTAYILHKIYKLPWMAELHDPLILDDQTPKWHKYFYNRFVERIICNNAAIVVYFTNQALKNAERRHPIKNKGIVVRPGANPPDFHDIVYNKKDKISFGHFGSLAKMRNLGVFIKALHGLIEKEPTLKGSICLHVYGCELDVVSRKTLREYPLGDSLIEHGRLEYDPKTGKSGRQQVMEAMKNTDVLVLLHGVEGSVCYEYIPSKLYEYLLTRRPILGLVQTGTELEEFLIENDHTSVDKDDIVKVKEAIESYVHTWDTEGLDDNQVASPFTVDATVDKLMAAVSEIDAVS